MKTLLTGLAVLIFFSISQAQLSGSYTIGGSNPNYATIAAGIAALEQQGISGPVQFNIRDGYYNEQLVITKINGSSIVNTITFESESGDSALVFIHFDPQSPNKYLFKLDSTDNIIFNNLTFKIDGSSDLRSVIWLTDGSKNITISDCHFLNALSSNYSSGTVGNIYLSNSTSQVDSALHVMSCNLDGGARGIAIGHTASTFIHDVKISGCTFSQNTARILDITKAEYPVIEHNNFYSSNWSSSTFAINLSSGNNGALIQLNKFYLAAHYSYAFNISSNNNSSASYPFTIINNFVSFLGPVSGQICQALDSYTNVYHNNFLIEDPSSPAGFFQSSHQSTDVNIFNNNVMSRGSGIMYQQPGTNSYYDFNNYMYGGSFSLQQATLDDYQLAYGQDLNSLNTDPNYYSTTDLHVQNPLVNNAGVSENILTDIDGDARNLVSPDIGADEFTPLTNDAGLVYLNTSSPNCDSVLNVRVAIKNFGLSTLNSAHIKFAVNGIQQIDYNWNGALVPGHIDTLSVGTYTSPQNVHLDFNAWTMMPNNMPDGNSVNDTTATLRYLYKPSGNYIIGSGGDFTTLGEATEFLNEFGVCRPTIMKIKSGVYSEKINLSYIKGLSSANTVTFTSLAGNMDSVIFLSSADVAHPYLVQINHSSYITFRDLTFHNTSSTLAVCCEIRNSAHQINLIDNRIISDAIPNSNEKGAVFVDYLVDTCNIVGNNITAQYGIETGGYYSAGTFSYHVKISHNKIRFAYAGISTYANYGYEVDHNILMGDSVLKASAGIIFKLCNQPNFSVHDNQIYLPYGLYGLFIQQSSPWNVSDTNLVYNNFISVTNPTATDSTMPIRVKLSSRIKFLDNNLYLNAPNDKSICLRAYDMSSHLYFFNNNFVVQNEGKYLSDYGGSPDGSDYNNYIDLTAPFQPPPVPGNNDQHSVSIDPQYVSPNDLHIQNALAEGLGMIIPSIPTDIDGDLRDGIFPDIGADESVSHIPDLEASFLQSPFASQCATNPALVVAVKNVSPDTINSFDVYWQINGQNYGPQHWTGGIGIYDTTFVNLGTINLSDTFYHDIKVWTKNPNNGVDANSNNDTIDYPYYLLNGTLTLGGINPTFHTFLEAITALYKCGVCSPIVINVRDGVYPEQLTFDGNIPGSSSINTITFRGEFQDSTTVTIQHLATDTASNFLIKFDSSAHIIFNHIGFRPLDSVMTENVSIKHLAIDIEFNGCFFRAINAHYEDTKATLFRLYHHVKFDSLRLIGNRFQYGNYGVQFEASTGDTSGVLLVENNTFFHQNFDQLHLFGELKQTLISNNYFESKTFGEFNYNVQINIHNSHGFFDIVGNRIWVRGASGTHNNTSDGIDIINSEPSNTRSLIANNIIYARDSSSYDGNDGNGIYLENAVDVDVFHNNIWQRGNDGRGIWILSTSSGIRMANNIESAWNLYYGLSDASSQLTFCDYNVFYGSNSGFLPCMDPAWQTWVSEGYDTHSVCADPGLDGPWDDFSCSPVLDNKGSSVAQLAVDIDSVIRNMNTPDIGVKEFNLSPVPLDLGEDTLYCGTNSVILDGYIGNDFTYAWSDGDSSPTKTITNSGSYSLIAINQQACQAAWDTINLTLSPGVQNPFTFSDTTGCNGNNIILDGGQNFMHDWSTGDSSQSITVNVSGNYVLTLSDTLGCVDSFAINVNFVGCNGIEDIDKQWEVRVSPNPCDNYCHMLFNNVNSFTAELLDLKGEVISIENVNEVNELTFSTQNIPSGMYLVRIRTDGNSSVYKLVVNHGLLNH